MSGRSRSRRAEQLRPSCPVCHQRIRRFDDVRYVTRRGYVHAACRETDPLHTRPAKR